MAAQSKYINNSSVIMTFMQRGWTDTNEMNEWLIANESLEFETLLKAIPSKNAKDDLTNFGEHEQTQSSTPKVEPEEPPKVVEPQPEETPKTIEPQPEEVPQPIQTPPATTPSKPTVLVQDGGSAFKAKAVAAAGRTKSLVVSGAGHIVSGASKAAGAVGRNSKSIFDIIKLILILIIAVIVLVILLKLLSVAAGGIEFIDNALDSAFHGITGTIDAFAAATPEEWGDAMGNMGNDVATGNWDKFWGNWGSGANQIGHYFGWW